MTLDESGGDGLVPVSSLPNDYYEHDEVRHRLVGKRFGKAFSLGDAVEVELTEANPFTGGLVFRLMVEGRPSAGRPPAGRGKPGTGRPGRKTPGKKERRR